MRYNSDHWHILCLKIALQPINDIQIDMIRRLVKQKQIRVLHKIGFTLFLEHLVKLKAIAINNPMTIYQNPLLIFHNAIPFLVITIPDIVTL
jgi:hypothetical protein